MDTTRFQMMIASVVRLVPAFLVLRPRTFLAGPQQNDFK